MILILDVEKKRERKREIEKERKIKAARDVLGFSVTNSKRFSRGKYLVERQKSVRSIKYL